MHSQHNTMKFFDTGKHIKEIYTLKNIKKHACWFVSPVKSSSSCVLLPTKLESRNPS